MMQSAALFHRGQMVAMLYTVLRHPTFKNVFAMYKNNESQAYNDDYYRNIVMMTTLMIMITNRDDRLQRTELTKLHLLQGLYSLHSHHYRVRERGSREILRGPH